MNTIQGLIDGSSVLWLVKHLKIVVGQIISKLSVTWECDNKGDKEVIEKIYVDDFVDCVYNWNFEKPLMNYKYMITHQNFPHNPHLQFVS